MPDFSAVPLKFNPGPFADRDVDRTGQLLVGGKRGLIAGWTTASGIVVAGGGQLHSSLDADVAALGYVKGSGTGEFPPIPQRAMGRFTNADGTGTWVLGWGRKFASGASAAETVPWHAIQQASIGGNWLMLVRLWLMVNNVALPSSVPVEAGWWPFTTGGGADTMTFTPSNTGRVTSTYSSGLGATGAQGHANNNVNRRTDFLAMPTPAGTKYVAAVRLTSAVPAGCVLDVEVEYATFLL